MRKRGAVEILGTLWARPFVGGFLVEDDDFP